MENKSLLVMSDMLLDAEVTAACNSHIHIHLCTIKKVEKKAVQMKLEYSLHISCWGTFTVRVQNT